MADIVAIKLTHDELGEYIKRLEADPREEL